MAARSRTPSAGTAILDRLAEELAAFGVVEQRPMQEGRNMTMLMAPSKAVLADQLDADGVPTGVAEADAAETPVAATDAPAAAADAPAAAEDPPVEASEEQADAPPEAPAAETDAPQEAPGPTAVVREADGAVS